jgi:transcriptional regulator GlxA family with amidase domain
LVIITDIDRAQLPGRASGVPIAAIVSSARPCTVLRELVAVRAIDDVPPPHAAVTAALNFIADHHDACLTVRRIAKAANLSEDHLAHVFRDATGLSVKDYVTRLRMTIARRLLTETTDTVEAIATRVGFADGSTFSRTFKNVGGMAPGEFRRSQP